MNKPTFTARLRDSVTGLGHIIRSGDFDDAVVSYRDQTIDVIRDNDMWAIPLSNVVSICYDVRSIDMSTGEHGYRVK